MLSRRIAASFATPSSPPTRTQMPVLPLSSSLSSIVTRSPSMSRSDTGGTSDRPTGRAAPADDDPAAVGPGEQAACLSRAQAIHQPLHGQRPLDRASLAPAPPVRRGVQRAEARWDGGRRPVLGPAKAGRAGSGGEQEQDERETSPPVAGPARPGVGVFWGFGGCHSASPAARLRETARRKRTFPAKARPLQRRERS